MMLLVSNLVVICAILMHLCNAFTPSSHHYHSNNGIMLMTTNSNNSGNSSPSKFIATPITITSTSTSDPASSQPIDTTKVVDKVNSATLQFNNRLSAMAKNHDAITAPKVEKLLLGAVENYKFLNQTDSETTNNIITPNTYTFTNAITAWARCTRKDSAKHAQALLDQMHTLYKEEGWAHVRPSRISYNSVITAWARSRQKGSALQAEQLLRDMYKFYNNEEGGGGGSVLSGKKKE